MKMINEREFDLVTRGITGADEAKALGELTLDGWLFFSDVALESMSSIMKILLGVK